MNQVEPCQVQSSGCKSGLAEMSGVELGWLKLNQAKLSGVVWIVLGWV